MRDLMAVTARPEVISLAGGLPDTSTFPPESLAAQMSKIAAESAAAALQYGPTEGFDETKDCIVEVMAAEGMLPDPDDIVVTTGGQQAIDLVTKTLVDPGDVVICEAPTYPGAVPVFCSYQADVRQVEMDGDGMRIDLLEALLEELRAEGRRPKFIYTVPSFQNPGGVTLSLERRVRLVELAPGVTAFIALPALAAALTFGVCGTIALAIPGQKPESPGATRNPFELMPLLIFALLFAFASTASAALALQFKEQGLLASSAIAGAFDVDASVLSALRLSKHSISIETIGQAVLTALMANAIGRLCLAMSAGPVKFWLPLAGMTLTAATAGYCTMRFL